VAWQESSPATSEDREKSGGESGGSFSPDAGYERRISYHAPDSPERPDHRQWVLISLMYRNRVTNGIIAIIVAYNATQSYYVDTASMIRSMLIEPFTKKKSNSFLSKFSFLKFSVMSIKFLLNFFFFTIVTDYFDPFNR